MSIACPLIFDQVSGAKNVLAISDANAQLQLLHGPLNDNETLAEACCRLLLSHTGLNGYPRYVIKAWSQQQWGFYIMDVEIPEHGLQFTDQHGTTHNFVWQSLVRSAENWEQTSLQALQHVKLAIQPQL